MIKKSALVLILLTFVPGMLLAADVTGKWDFTSKSSYGETYELILVLQEQDGKLTGTLGNWDGSIPLEKVTLEGDKLTFDVYISGVTYTAELAVSGKEMTGSYEGTNGNSGTITAKHSGE